MKNRLFLMLPLAASFIGAGSMAHGQIRGERLTTNLPGIMATAKPPAEFDYSRASDAELEMYGLPPRPNEFTQPQAHAAWKKAMSAAKEQIVPQLEQTNIFHGPAQRSANSSEASTNWSGVVAYTYAQSFNYSSSFHFVAADYVVPVATQAYGTCNGGWVYSSSWVGIDGSGSNDVLQAGTESDAFCSQGTTVPYYAAWIEWFPYGSVRVSNFPIGPGDDLFVEVWNTSSTQGYAYILNYRTNRAVGFALTPPPGTTLVGNSAEWVVERPGINGSVATLANYISDYFSNCYAASWNQEGYVPSGASAAQITMIDDGSRPISYPTVLGATAIWFQDEGSAR